MKHSLETFKTKIWYEIPEPDNPFAARNCYCAGYDVFGELIEKAKWSEYVYIIFKGEKPTKHVTDLIESLAVILAHPGIRDPSVRAAMNAGVSGSPAAACLMAALSVGAGQYGGAREVALFHKLSKLCGQDIAKWEAVLLNPDQHDAFRSDRWYAIEHPPGFDPHGTVCPLSVQQALIQVANQSSGNFLPWLRDNRLALESIVGMPLTLVAVSGAAFVDLDFSAEEAEMLFMILRLPGAAVHAIEQKRLGWAHYPFFKDSLHLKE